MTNVSNGADTAPQRPTEAADIQPSTVAEVDAFYAARRAASRAQRRAAKRQTRTSDQGSVQTSTTAPTAERLGTGETEFPPPQHLDGEMGALTCTVERIAGGLGGAKSETADDPESAAERARVARMETRFANRRVLWAISRNPAIRACGRGVIDHDQGVTFKRTSDGRVYVTGTTRCHSIWSCPCDAATIRAVRAADASEACVRHIRAGGTAFLVTLTARHFKRHKLADLLDGIREAFTALTTGAQWAGDRARGREGERQRMGVVGIIRSTEVTYGRNGWHPHLHLIVLMGAWQSPRPEVPRKKDRPEGWTMPEWDPRPVDHSRVPDLDEEIPDDCPHAERMRTLQDGLRRMQDRWDRQWANWLGKHGFRPNQKHGVRWDRIESEAAAGEVGQYVAKVQDGDGRSFDPGNELARIDMKSADRMRGAETDPTSRTPFQLLDDYRKLRALDAETAAALGIDVPRRLAKIRAVWREYEEATKGRRAIEWSRGLRDALEMPREVEDGAAVEAEGQGDAFAGLETATWRRVCRLGQDYALVRSGELGGFIGLTVALASLGLDTPTPMGTTGVEEAQQMDHQLIGVEPAPAPARSTAPAPRPPKPEQTPEEIEARIERWRHPEPPALPAPKVDLRKRPVPPATPEPEPGPAPSSRVCCVCGDALAPELGTIRRHLLC